MPGQIKHLAIIMDGNRRWAKERGMPGIAGHKAGYERLKEIAEATFERGIDVLSVFAFSTENWRRSAEEVGYLMELFELALTKDFLQFADKGIRLKVIGRREGLSRKIVEAIDDIEAQTEKNDKGTLAVCINYGGRAEIVDACKKIIADGLSVDEVDESAITSRMYWPEMPDPDLVIRTSGEERLSGFLTWEGVYSEIYWCEKKWPDFDQEELDKAVEEYASRQRRYGGG
ncbi:MAG: polyprenyl diphosphate synthase [Patescibacteria group bacterium]|nr:polyprenyl diphosphate synthase [Patescibacteria group bacterium]